MVSELNIIKNFEIITERFGLGNPVEDTFPNGESNKLFTKDTFYTILWDCRLCTDNYLLISNAPENQANPYLVAIPMYVVGNE